MEVSQFRRGSSPEHWLINPTDNPGRIKSTDHCNQLTGSLWYIKVWIQRSMHFLHVHTYQDYTLNRNTHYTANDKFIGEMSSADFFFLQQRFYSERFA